MRDSFKRQIDYLRVSVTDRCNLKCVYCIPEKKLRYFRDSDILTNEEITRFVRTALKHGLRKVRITGGEPLIRGDIIELVFSLKKAGVPDLSMTTNGIKLSRMARPLKDAGLDRVNISLDTLKAERYKEITRGGDIQSVWDGVEESERAGLSPVKINVVPIRGINDDEILEFASLTFERDFHVRFIEFMPAGRNKLWSDDVCVKKHELMERISVLGNIIQLRFRGRGPSRNYKIEGAKGIIGFISPLSDCFCEFCNRLRLAAHGKIRPCLFSDVEIDVKSPMRGGVSDEGLDEIFRSAILAKPEGRYLSRGDYYASNLLSMSEIGG